jgi:hypothetical protein
MLELKLLLDSASLLLFLADVLPPMLPTQELSPVLYIGMHPIKPY